jgi:hypothetical protein
MPEGAGWIQLAPFFFPSMLGAVVPPAPSQCSITTLVIACRSPWRSTA